MKFDVVELSSKPEKVRIGQKIYLSGTIYTARDAAHKRIVGILNKGGSAPFNFVGAAVYYCGPSPSKPGEIIGACGPTTSSRMDIWTPQILEQGVKILIGKGKRSDETNAAIVSHKALYLVATGGIAALLSQTVISAKVKAFEDLGPEAVYELQIKDMPLIVATDIFGGDIFK
jgi:fumarate hydratase subunit beta